MARQHCQIKIVDKYSHCPDPFTKNREIYLLTGKINSGKTTTICSWISQWEKRKVRVAGVVSKAVFEKDKKIGYNVLDIKTAAVFPIIRTKPFLNSWTIGNFFFDATIFADLSSRILKNNSCDIVVIDEVGPLELQLKKGFYNLFIHFLCNSNSNMVIVVRESEVSSVEKLIRNFLS